MTEKKQKGFLSRFLCGLLMGFGFIVPGVSGSAIAIMFGIYEDLVDSVSDILKKFKQSVLFLLPVALGVASSVAALYFPLLWLLKKNCFVVIMLFAGLLAGALKPMLKEVEWRKAPKWHYAVFAISFLAVIGIGCLSLVIKGNGVDMSNPNAFHYIMMLVCGVLFAISTVVPGISGTALLLAVGFYYPIYDGLISSTIEQVLNFEIVWSNIALLALFAIGIVVGAFVVAKIIKFCFKANKKLTYISICGFAIGSIPAIFVSQDWGTPKFNDEIFIKLPMSPLTIVLSIIAIVGGFCLSYYLMCYKEKKENQLEKPLNPQEEIQE